MAIRTDLAVESRNYLKEKIDGVEQKVEDIDGINVITIKIKTKKAADIVKRPIGVYITLQHKDILLPENMAKVKDILISDIEKFFKDKKNILVVGLGNRNITPDGVGPQAADKIVATRHIDDKLKTIFGFEDLKVVSVIAPGVLGQTGIETIEIIKSINNCVKPDLIVAIDALAARSFKRLGATFQITDTGIAPGSGVENKRKELSKNVLGVPVLVIGVPTVVDMHDFKERDECDENSEKAFMFVTPKNIDLLVKRSATVIAESINKVLFPQISEEELKILAG